jgi:hypothetical protein
MNAIKERGHEMHTAVCTPAIENAGKWLICHPDAQRGV